MDEDNEKVPRVGSWSEFLSGGLPQVLLGPAGKSLSRLISGMTDIPSAWLEQKAQAIRDETEARSQVMKVLAQKAGTLGAADTQLIARGLDHLVHSAFRAQKNREAIAAATIELLNEEPADASAIGPTDDWLNVFETYAAKASSDGLRGLFARILAGEVRKQGSFSLATMQLVAVLDSRLADLIHRLAPHVWDGSILKKTVEGIVTYDELLELDSIGFLTATGTVNVKLSPDELGRVPFKNRDVAVVATFEKPSSVHQRPVYPVSFAARPLLQVISYDPDVTALAGALWPIGPKRIQAGRLRLADDSGGDYIVEFNRDLVPPQPD